MEKPVRLIDWIQQWDEVTKKIIREAIVIESNEYWYNQKFICCVCDKQLTSEDFNIHFSQPPFNTNLCKQHWKYKDVFQIDIVRAHLGYPLKRLPALLSEKEIQEITDHYKMLYTLNEESFQSYG